MDASPTNTRENQLLAPRAETDWVGLTTGQRIRSIELDGYVVIPDLHDRLASDLRELRFVDIGEHEPHGFHRVGGAGPVDDEQLFFGCLGGLHRFLHAVESLLVVSIVASGGNLDVALKGQTTLRGIGRLVDDFQQLVGHAGIGPFAQGVDAELSASGVFLRGNIADEVDQLLPADTSHK